MDMEITLNDLNNKNAFNILPINQVIYNKF